jgi:hypothetical protein
MRASTLLTSIRPEKESVLAPVDELAGDEVVDEASVHVPIEVEIEAVEGALGVATVGLFGATLEQAPSPTADLVGDEQSDEVDWRHTFGLRLLEARLDGGHAAEAQLFEGSVEFNEGSVGGSLVSWLM